MTKLDEIKQALEAAAPGPWTFESNRVGSHDVIYDANDDCVGSTAQQEDARLIVEAVNNLPKLLKVAEAAKDLPYLYDQASADPYDVGYSQVSDEIELLRKALEELNDE